jgi:hypothetical protein
VKRTVATLACAALLVPALAGCTFIGTASEYNGLPGQQGRPVEYYTATKVGVNLLFVIPLIGDTSTGATLRDLTKRIKDDGGTNVRVVQSSGSIYWYLLMPVTFIVHPSVTSVSADAEFYGPRPSEKKDGKKEPQPGDKAAAPDPGKTKDPDAAPATATKP